MRQKRSVRYAIGYSILAILLCVLLIWNLNAGSVNLSVREVLEILAGHNSENTAIIWEIDRKSVV